MKRNNSKITHGNLIVHKCRNVHFFCNQRDNTSTKSEAEIMGVTIPVMLLFIWNSHADGSSPFNFKLKEGEG